MMPMMYIVSLETRIPIPEWFKLRLFDDVEEAMKWAKKASGHDIMMTPSEDTSMCVSFNCGDMTVKIKRVKLNDNVPFKYHKFYNKIMGEDN